jgi:hypothetical protein
MFLSSGEERATPTLLGPLERGNLNVVFSSLLEFRTTGRVLKPTIIRPFLILIFCVNLKGKMHELADIIQSSCSQATICCAHIHTQICNSHIKV